MHEELRVTIDYQNYVKAFYEWVKTNKGKLSTEFDKEIGIAKWKKENDESTVAVKDPQKLIIAKLKYDI